MGDVILRLPVQGLREAQLFGACLGRFLEDRSEMADRWAADNDAPYVMVHSHPQTELEMKVVTFQEPDVASAFGAAWALAAGRARTGAAAG